MKGKEQGNDDAQRRSQEVSCYQVVRELGIKGVVPKERGEERPGREHQERNCQRAIEEHVHEVFVVVEAYAVSYPRTMMIHF